MWSSSVNNLTWQCLGASQVADASLALAAASDRSDWALDQLPPWGMSSRGATAGVQASTSHRQLSARQHKAIANLASAHATSGAAIPGTRQVAMGTSSGCVIVVDGRGGTSVGVAWPLAAVRSDNPEAVVDAALAKQRAGNGGITRVTASVHNVVVSFDGTGLFAWRCHGVGPDQPRVLEGRSGYLNDAELQRTPVTHVAVRGSLCFACTARGTVLCVDLGSQQRYWHTEQVFVGCTGLHAVGAHLFAGTVQGLVAVDIQRLSVLGVSTVYRHDVSFCRCAHDSRLITSCRMPDTRVCVCVRVWVACAGQPWTPGQDAGALAASGAVCCRRRHDAGRGRTAWQVCVLGEHASVAAAGQGDTGGHHFVRASGAGLRSSAGCNARSHLAVCAPDVLGGSAAATSSPTPQRTAPWDPWCTHSHSRTLS